MVGAPRTGEGLRQLVAYLVAEEGRETVSYTHLTLPRELWV